MAQQLVLPGMPKTKTAWLDAELALKYPAAKSPDPANPDLDPNASVLAGEVADAVLVKGIPAAFLPTLADLLRPWLVLQFARRAKARKLRYRPADRGYGDQLQLNLEEATVGWLRRLRLTLADIEAVTADVQAWADANPGEITGTVPAFVKNLAKVAGITSKLAAA